MPKKKRESITLKWSKKIRDWEAKYPEWKNRNARILSLNFLEMIASFERWKKEDLEKVIENAGFDPETFQIVVKAKETK